MSVYTDYIQEIEERKGQGVGAGKTAPEAGGDCTEKWKGCTADEYGNGEWA